MKTYNFFRGNQPIRKDEFLNYAPENWEVEISEDSDYQFNWGIFKAVLISEECECEDCDGNGMVEQFAGSSCGRRTEDCCGGCYVDIECSTCEGSGIVTNEY